MPEKPKKNIKKEKEKNKQKKKNKYGIDPFAILRNVFAIIIGVSFLIFTVYSTIKTYKMKRVNLVRGTNYAYRIIQDELVTYYKQFGYVYESKDENVDKFCEVLGNKYAEDKFDCTDSGGISKTNFVFKKKKIEIIGMEKPPFDFMGTLVKDFIIDINGSGKGKDEFGEDRVPVRIYSTGRMGGLLSPVNCSHSDMMDFGIEYAEICHNGPEIDFMATKIPFGYDIFQIGGPNGKTKAINRDVSFLRADCSAFGGDMANLESYCDDKGYFWRKECYDDYECSVWLSKRKL